jgi:hypothetical protein
MRPFQKVKDGHRRVGISKGDDSILVCAILLEAIKTNDEL